ncbi:MAG: ParA family protein [Sandaracinaceae bacterium]|nr:ParA family protein [Sandaracinaceae bacterium]
MSVRITVTSQKGGVGKTTVCLNLAVAFAERGWRTLIVDLDPHGHRAGAAQGLARVGWGDGSAGRRCRRE